MSAPDILDNMSRGWNCNPAAVALGTDRTGISAALWSSNDDEVQEVWAEPSDVHHVSLQLASVEAEMFVDGRRVFDARGGLGCVNIIQANERPRAVLKSSYHMLHFYVPASYLNETAQSVGSRATEIELFDPKFSHDAAIERIGGEVMAEMAEGQPLSRLRVDSLGQDLVIQLLRRYSAFADTSALGRQAKGGLAPWQVRRLTERLEDNLGEDISLATLAELIGLSPNYFCTAFRISLGEPPHRYLLRRRIERAKEMLSDPRHSVTDVALAVGFGSSAHFATAFRREVGVTPSLYRREQHS